MVELTLEYRFMHPSLFLKIFFFFLTKVLQYICQTDRPFVIFTSCTRCWQRYKRQSEECSLFVSRDLGLVPVHTLTGCWQERLAKVSSGKKKGYIKCCGTQCISNDVSLECKVTAGFVTTNTLSNYRCQWMDLTIKRSCWLMQCVWLDKFRSSLMFVNGVMQSFLTLLILEVHGSVYANNVQQVSWHNTSFHFHLLCHWNGSLRL